MKQFAKKSSPIFFGPKTSGLKHVEHLGCWPSRNWTSEISEERVAGLQSIFTSTTNSAPPQIQPTTTDLFENGGVGISKIPSGYCFPEHGLNWSCRLETYKGPA
jgi:hypothetical protein